MRRDPVVRLHRQLDRGPSMAHPPSHGPRPIGPLLQRVGLVPGDLQVLRSVAVPAMVVAAVGASRFGGLWAVVVLSLAGVMSVSVAVRRVRRRAERLVTELAQLVEATARSLRSGASFIGALDEAAADCSPQVATGVGGLTGAIRRGRAPSEALETWAEHAARPEFRVVASALVVAAQHEAAASRALDGVAQSLRQRADLAAEIHALTSQSASSMRALVVLPVAFLALDLLLGGRALDYLTTQPLGRLCLGAGLGLQTIAWVWSQRLLRRALT